MKKLIALTFTLAVIASPLLLWWVLFSEQPRVENAAARMNSDSLASIQQLLNQRSDGRIDLTEGQLNQLLRYGVQQSPQASQLDAAVGLKDGGGRAYLVYDTGLPLRPYLNLAVDLGAAGRDVTVEGLEIGRLRLPAPVAEAIWQQLWTRLRERPDVQPLIEGYRTVENIEVAGNRLRIDYHMDAELAADLQQRQVEMLFGRSVTELLPLYQQRLRETLSGLGGQRVSLAAGMQPLFRLALQRSAEGGDPVAENKALILALALHGAPAEVVNMLGVSGPVSRPGKPIRFTLEGKRDLAQHFITTAAITAFANGELADLIALYKELQDHQGASGFGVADLVADRAGTAFARAATSDAESARAFQQRMEGSAGERFFMPDTGVITREVEEMLIRQAESGDETSLIDAVNRTIGALVMATPAYQSS